MCMCVCVGGGVRRKRASERACERESLCEEVPALHDPVRSNEKERERERERARESERERDVMDHCS
jgi:hypothetical protein